MSAFSGRRHRKRKLKAEINVVPYIDVMLVLLVIFMVTAPLLTLGVDVDLPQSNARSVDNKKDPIVVSVYPDGALALAVKAGSNEAITRQALEAKMRAIVSQNPDAPVFVAGDGTANYQQVLDVMALLQNAQVKKVGLMSQPKQGGSR
jgi:biopolymer transport protein TolR